MSKYLKILGVVLLALLVNAKVAAGQNSRWDYIAMTTSGHGQAVPLLAIPGAGVTFYSCSAGVCSTLANTYNSASSVSACPTSTQVVRALGASCVATADSQGNFGAWFLAGQYAYTLLIQGVSYGPYPFTVGGGGSGGSGIVGGGTTGQFAQYGSPGTTVGGATMSGDAALAVGGALTFNTVNSNVGTCGDATHVGVPTLNAKGLATACNPVAITFPSGGAVLQSNGVANISQSLQNLSGGAGITVTNPSGGNVFITNTATPFSATSGGVFNTSANTSRNMTGTDVNTILGYTPATGPNFTNDFAACYVFLETPTIGGALVDHCGNNNGVVGAVAPVSDGVGWQWTPDNTSPVVLPAALNAGKTFYFTVNIPPAIGGSFLSPPQLITFLGGTVVNNAVFTGGISVSGFQTYSSFKMVSGGATYAQMANNFNGVAILTYVCDATKDLMYYNGVLVPNLVTPPGSLCSRQLTGSYEIGGTIDSANLTMSGEFHDLRISFNEHNVNQVKQNVAALYNEIVGRGILLAPNRFSYPIQQLFFAGDSITCGLKAGGTPACVPGATPWIPGTTSSNAYTNNLVLDQTFGIQNFGVVSALVEQQMSAAPVLYAPLCGSQSGQTIGFLFEGTNDNGTSSAAVTWSVAASWAALMKSYGCKTGYIGMISRGGTAGGVPYDTFKTQLDALARANWKQAGFNVFVDSEADTFMGCAGCYANATYFDGDQIHPTAGGQTKQALMIQGAVNYTSNGSTPENPNPTVITAATYTSIVNDGGLIFNTSANNIVDTLTSARWMSGRIISRCNRSTSGTNTLTITAPSDYPFNNVGGLTTVTVANNTCQKFQSTYVAGTPNGDFWALTQ